jgi:hypothetical protein
MSLNLLINLFNQNWIFFLKTLTTNRTIYIMFNILSKAFIMQIMLTLSKRNNRISRCKKITKTYATYITFKCWDTFMNVEINQRIAHTTFITMFYILLIAYSTYSTLFTMKDFFIWIIIPKFTYITIIVSKFNFTILTLIRLLLNSLTV